MKRFGIRFTASSPDTTKIIARIHNVVKVLAAFFSLFRTKSSQTIPVLYPVFLRQPFLYQLCGRKKDGKTVSLFLNARAAGDRNVIYIDGASVFRGQYQEMCTVDGTHPNDLGFALLAGAIGAELKVAMTQHLLIK